MSPESAVLRPVRCRSRLPFIMIAIALLGFTQAWGAVTPVSASREVTAFASISAAPGGQGATDHQQITSPGYGSFDESVHAHAAIPEEGSTADGYAAQISSIGSGLIQAQGEFRAFADLKGETPFGEGHGFSRVEYRFSVTGMEPVTLAGLLEGSGNGRTFVSLIKLNAGVLVYQFAEQGQRPIFEQEALDAGVYEFAVWTTGFGQAIAPGEPTPASGRFTMSLSFAEPAGVAATTQSVGRIEAWPNPVRNGTTLTLGGLAGVADGLVITDAAGRLVRDLGRPAGASVPWDARDERGERLPPGIYFARAGSGPAAKLIVLR